jgi:hypothetical protein
VKIKVSVPDHRKEPGRPGRIWQKGAVTGWGMRPRATMGSENTTRTSLASASSATSPWGAACRTVSARPGSAAQRQGAIARRIGPGSHNFERFIVMPSRTGASLLALAREVSKKSAARPRPDSAAKLRPDVCR